MNLSAVKNLILYAGLDKYEYNRIIPDIKEENRNSLKIYSIIATGLFTFITLSNYLFKSFNSINGALYLSGALASLAVCLISFLFTEKHKNLVMPMVYIFMAILYSEGLGLLYLQREKLAVTFIVLLLVIPLLFSDRPIRMILITIVADIAFCVLTSIFKPHSYAVSDVWNGIIFGLVAVFIEAFVIRVRVKNIMQTQKIAELSESDLLTGTKNRNCYEKNMASYASGCEKNVCCIYGDLNGLHELNNTKGHKAGDTMIQTVALELMRFYDRNDIYRMGGDEYVVLVKDTDGKQVEENLKEIDEDCQKYGYYVALGYAIMEKEKLGMEELIKQAEEKMYEAKSQYYRKNHIDRRKR